MADISCYKVINNINSENILYVSKSEHMSKNVWVDTNHITLSLSEKKAMANEFWNYLVTNSTVNKSTLNLLKNIKNNISINV